MSQRWLCMSGFCYPVFVAVVGVDRKEVHGRADAEESTCPLQHPKRALHKAVAAAEIQNGIALKPDRDSMASLELMATFRLAREQLPVGCLAALTRRHSACWPEIHLDVADQALLPFMPRP